MENEPTTTPAVAAAVPAANEGAKPAEGAPAAVVAPKETLLGSAARTAEGAPAEGTVIPDATKNSDGTDKTPEQIEADKKTADDAKKKDAGAPETYGDFTLPEGVTIPPEALTSFSALAKESNLSQEAAQKFIDAATAHTASVLKQGQEGQMKAWNEVRDKWVGEVQADHEVGGTNLPKSKELAFRAVQAFGGTEAERNRLITEVFDAGFGDHPLFFKMMTRIGKRVSSDTFVESGKPPADTNQTTARKLYPGHA